MGYESKESLKEPQWASIKPDSLQHCRLGRHSWTLSTLSGLGGPHIPPLSTLSGLRGPHIPLTKYRLRTWSASPFRGLLGFGFRLGLDRKSLSSCSSTSLQTRK